MNLLPTILAHAAFLERPRSRRVLNSAFGLIENKFSILKERHKTQPTVAISSGGDPHNRVPFQNVPPNSHPYRCWNWGHLDHERRNCRQSFRGRETGRRPAVARPPGRNLECVSQNCCGTSQDFISFSTRSWVWVCFPGHIVLTLLSVGKSNIFLAVLHEAKKPYLHLCVEVADWTTVVQARPKFLNRGVLMDEFPSLFSSSLVTAKCTPYDIEISDTTPVRSPLYRCAPP